MLADEFKKHEIVPDVISIAPDALLHIRFNSGVTVDAGSRVLTPTQVKGEPHVSFAGADPNSLYTLILTDPDAPSRKEPIYREWHHWLVVNIPGDDIAKGDVLSEYVESGPPRDTGLHRFVFLFYKQPGRIDDAEHGKLTNRSVAKRDFFSAQKFANKHKLGNPIAGNFYEAEYDDYVPTVHKQLGFQQ